MDRAADRRPPELLAEMHELRLVLPEGVDPHPRSEKDLPTIHLQGAGRRFVRRATSWLLAEKERYDLIIAQGDSDAAMAANLATRVGGRPSLLLLDRPTIDFARALGLSGSSLAKLKLQTWVNHRLARSSVQTDAYTASKAFVSEPRVIPLHGVDVEHYQPGPQKGARRALGINHNGQLVLLLSRPPNYDLATFMKALQVVTAEQKDVGAIFFDPSAKEQAEDAGLPAWLVTDDQGPTAYRAADVVVHACVTEGLEMRLLEAMSCGASIVASATWSLAELVGHTGAGIVSPIGDELVLADGILWHLRNPDGAKKYGELARELIQEQFDTREVKDLWERAIEEAAGGS